MGHENVNPDKALVCKRSLNRFSLIWISVCKWGSRLHPWYVVSCMSDRAHHLRYVVDKN